MFSQTRLGNFLTTLSNTGVLERLSKSSPLAIIALLLADAVIYSNTGTRKRLLGVLGNIYGSEGTYRFREILDEELRQAIYELIESLDPGTPKLSRAYLSGIVADRRIESYSFFKDKRIRSVYLRQLARFHSYNPQLQNKSSNGSLPIVILGLKAAGKSAVMQELVKRGEHIHEVYGFLDQIAESLLINGVLPAKDQWDDEPLCIGLKHRGWYANPPKRFFIGSLLRLSEVELLSALGNPYLVHIKSDNKLRHDRARRRGRIIEAKASEEKLIELDAHRSGDWPEYELNDVSLLISLANITIINSEETDVSQLVDLIFSSVENL